MHTTTVSEQTFLPAKVLRLHDIMGTKPKRRTKYVPSLGVHWQHSSLILWGGALLAGSKLAHSKCPRVFMEEESQ